MTSAKGERPARIPADLIAHFVTSDRGEGVINCDGNGAGVSRRRGREMDMRVIGEEQW